MARGETAVGEHAGEGWDMNYLAITPELIKRGGDSDIDLFLADQPWLTEKEIVLHGLTLISCKHCLDLGWVCEIHPTRPWAGIVGDVLGCEPDCGGTHSTRFAR